jgi:gas vesicle protein
MDKIDATNKELINKKNENARPFDNEIIALKSKLSGFRQEHNQLKTDIMTNGKTLAEELNILMKETDNAINEKYKEVSRDVKNTEPDPATADTVKTVNIVRQKFNGIMINHIAPLTVLPACYQNEIIALMDTIAFWNAKALALIHQDAELKIKLEPLDKKLAEYLATPKQNQKLHKDDISALKKQIEGLNKERKHLAKQMVADSEKLANNLDKMNEEVRAVVKERFEDAIENINYSYQDKF